MQVGLGDHEVALDHLQGLVAEDGLQGKDVAAVAQEGDGPGGGLNVKLLVGRSRVGEKAVDN